MRICLFFFLLFSSILSGFTQETPSQESQLKDLIAEHLQNFPDQTQFSIAIIQNDKTNFSGFLKNKDHIENIDNHQKIFEIGSLTKVFTATVLASLVEEQKIDLRDEINSYYPFQFKDDLRISFERLANHTSGLPRLPGNLNLFADMNNPYKNYTAEDLNDYLKKYLVVNNPDTYQYSNLGAGLLGHSLALVTEKSFEELLKSIIFEPLQMKNSFTSSKNLQNRLVPGLNPTGQSAANWDFEVLSGAGGILSTTEDLSKFAIAQFDPENKAMAQSRQSTFVIDENMEIGLGWHLIKTVEKDLIYWHNGGTGGYSSSMIIDPKRKTSVIILSNVSGLHPQMEKIDQLCFQIFKNLEKD